MNQYLQASLHIDCWKIAHQVFLFCEYLLKSAELELAAIQARFRRIEL